MSDGAEYLAGIHQIFAGVAAPGSVRTRSRALRAAADGTPFDVQRAALFQHFIDRLVAHHHVPRIARGEQSDALPFYEAYFSNFIEGTEFENDEAERIVFEGSLPAGRSEDAHDVQCTYALTRDHDEMRVVPRSGAQLIDLLVSRHRVLMASRPDKRPGKFKQENNREGATAFVDHTLTRGTLLRGFELATQLVTPFQRAAYMLFVSAEVRPFVDGNGRISRLMMNAELIMGGEQRIVVPIAARGMYLGALRRLTRDGEPGPLIDCLETLQQMSVDVDWTDRTTARKTLHESGAFEDPDSAPTGWRLV